jgi:hypothetical protein
MTMLLRVCSHHSNSDFYSYFLCLVADTGLTDFEEERAGGILRGT